MNRLIRRTHRLPCQLLENIIHCICSELLLQTGRERDIGCLCYGHTHEPVAQLQSDGRWLINPGTAGGIGNRATYAVVQVEDGRLSVEIKEL